MSALSPRQVLEQLAAAIPAAARARLVVVGSLAVGYHYFGRDPDAPVRTKDVDCVIAPRVRAVEEGARVAELLLANHWRPRLVGLHTTPGTAATPAEDLPAVRLHPPESDEWFLELLTVPAAENERGSHWTRLPLSSGHYGLPSFEFLTLETHRPLPTDLGLATAQPPLMALAHLLEHPQVGAATMSGLIEGRRIKRGAKDLGRVLAIAALAGPDAVDSWPAIWDEALRECFPTRWRDLAPRAGTGLRELLSSDEDLEQAMWTCNQGLLASRPLSLDQMRATGLRVLQDAADALAALHPAV
jgi:hypothetical protein